MKKKQLKLMMKRNVCIDVDSVMPRFRTEYSKGKLLERSVSKDPFMQFTSWFETAVKARTPSVNAMTLATISKGKKPSARVVLLKGFSREGFVFFTSYVSPKARDMTASGKVSCVLFWPQLERQIRIDGRAVKISRNVSRYYFDKRPRGSQLAAWISHQSQRVGDRKRLEREFNIVQRRFASKPVPLPPNWGGYRIVPDTIEFWQGRANRLNDRIRFYRIKKNKWKIERLKP